MVIPDCPLSGAKQTFFFQIAYPDDRYWHGLSMAVFYYTTCAHGSYLIPEMLQGVLLEIDIPRGFLEDYQKNFTIHNFDTNDGIIRRTYKEKVRFKGWNLISTSTNNAIDHKLGGHPAWLLDDEKPETYKNTVPIFFLLQLVFEIVEDAPLK
ncbi:hypothetical protein [Siminovitchia terrae]|uniref:hypothetical protein n=1 Tax=Siminovitchia terrae TaxID=1914933 RepID=UPI0028A6B19B|nr:hypothetical protein [Siminovitchia terrae]